MPSLRETIAARREEQVHIRSSSTFGDDNLYGVEHDSKTNCFYYVNHSTGLSSWEVPGDFQFQPKHFEEHIDPASGATYYLNVLTGVSSWDVPICKIPVKSLVAQLPPPGPHTTTTETETETEHNTTHMSCAVMGCSGIIHNGGYCKTHYEIHLLDVGTRSRRNSGFAGTCGAPGCKRQLFRAGYCESHFHDHQRNLVDHTARDKAIWEENERASGRLPEKFDREVILLRSKAKKEEEQRRRDRLAADQFRIAQEERIAAIASIKARQARENYPPPPPQKVPPFPSPSPSDALQRQLEESQGEAARLRQRVADVETNERTAKLQAQGEQKEAERLRQKFTKVETNAALQAQQLEDQAQQLEDFTNDLQHQLHITEDKNQFLQTKLNDLKLRQKAVEEDIQVTHLKDMEMAQITNEAEKEKYKREAERLRQEKEELTIRQMELEAERVVTLAQEAEVVVQITHLKELETTIVEVEGPPAKERVVSSARQAILDDQNYNLKIAEALRKVEEEKRQRLAEEAAERRKQMELELLKEKNKGRNIPNQT